MLSSFSLIQPPSTADYQNMPNCQEKHNFGGRTVYVCVCVCILGLILAGRCGFDFDIMTGNRPNWY